ncbi:MAG: DMT family transporter [Rhizobiales bacterium]|nr:DMT family transporter [Hyphomicrobiales bacterium]
MTMSEGAPVRADRTAQGVGIILASVVTMAFADAVVKLVSADLTIWQIFAARSSTAVILLGVLLRALGIALMPRRLGWVLFRSVLLVLAWITFYTSLPVIPLSAAAAAAYTGPIMIALMSAALLREPVTPMQWAGVLLGFLGVAAIVRPGTDAFSWFTILPLLCAAFYALAMVLTRSKCRDEAPLALGLALHVCFVATGLVATGMLAVLGLAGETKSAFPFLLGDWAPMGLKEWGVMALLGVLSAAYFAGVARAYQIAPPQIIATFDYAYLVSAAVWGYVFFAETPGPLTIVGMILISLAGWLVAMPASRRVRPA